MLKFPKYCSCFPQDKAKCYLLMKSRTESHKNYTRHIRPCGLSYAELCNSLSNNKEFILEGQCYDLADSYYDNYSDGQIILAAAILGIKIDFIITTELDYRFNVTKETILDLNTRKSISNV